MTASVPADVARGDPLPHRVPLLAIAAAAWLAMAGCSLEDTRRADSRPHHTASGFRNTYTPFLPEGFWRWQWERWTQGRPVTPEGGWRFPVRHPDVAFLRSEHREFTVTWIGHATVLLQLDGLNILTDPHFSARASPVSFLGPQRHVPPAMAPEELPHIDMVLISHNHYDHLDDASIRALARQPGGPPRFYVPLGLAAWFAERGVTTTVELDWWDHHATPLATVHLVPVQHWSARGLWDRNRTLWGGWVVEAAARRVLFVGDTGYSRDFADVGARFGSFDLALLPIGAYAPRWFMHRQHIDPTEAVRIHQDVRARQSMGIHWGTFALADEPLDEPPRRLVEALAAAGVDHSSFWVLEHGETRRLPQR